MTNNSIFNLSEVEKIIGVKFDDKSLIEMAFTHSSYVNEHPERKHNERLEFLGDSVLGAIIAEYLYTKFENEREGLLTDRKRKVVSKTPLYKAVLKLGLDKFLDMGVGERQSFLSGGQNRRSNLENLFEAIVGAIYLDKGFDVTKKFVLKNVENFDELMTDDDTHDYKSELQEFTQKYFDGALPEYLEPSKRGPDHKPTFSVELRFLGEKLAVGTGNSKKSAEKSAAKKALKILQSRINT